jgi:hypothetical protein
MSESCERGSCGINGLRSRRLYDKDFAVWLTDLSVGRNLHLNVADLVHFHNKLILKLRIDESRKKTESETNPFDAHLLVDMKGLDYVSYEPLQR